MNYKLTEAVKNTHLRGLGLGQKFGMKPEVVLKNKEELSLDEIKQLYNFLLKAKDKYEPKTVRHDGSFTQGTIDYLSNGGSPALAFCKCILRSNKCTIEGTFQEASEECTVEDVLPRLNLPVNKSKQEKLKQVTYVAMKVGTDLHGHYTDAETIRKAKESFARVMKRRSLENLFHLAPTSKYEVIESYQAPAEMVLNGHYVGQSDWLMTLQIYDDKLWQMIEDDEITGISIGADGILTKVK